jgi:hypothetical protein
MIKVKKIAIDLNDINNLITSLKTLSSDMKKLPNEICQEVAELGKEYLDVEYSQANVDQTIDVSSINTSIRQTNNGYQIIASGKDVIYEEFGTGEYGESQPHPEKGKYTSLKKYNSGPFVSTHINKYGRHYWFYKGYSEGNPSGAEMYNTAVFLKNKGIKDVLEKKASDVLSKV